MRRLKTALPYVALLLGLTVLAFHATLSTFLVKRVPSLRQLALQHLIQMGERALPHVLGLLGADEPAVRQAGMALLEAAGSGVDWAAANPELLGKVLDRFRSETVPALKGRLAAVLGASGAPEAIDALKAGLTDPSIRTACAGALETLAQRAPSPAVQAAARQAALLASSAEAGRAVSTAVELGSVAATSLAGLVATTALLPDGLIGTAVSSTPTVR